MYLAGLAINSVTHSTEIVYRNHERAVIFCDVTKGTDISPTFMQCLFHPPPTCGSLSFSRTLKTKHFSVIFHFSVCKFP